MTRLLFDAGETVFHFPLASNSRYLILAGNAKLWGCYPNCSSELGASGEPRKYEKQSVRNYFLLVVLGSALVFFSFFVCFFFKSWQLGLMLTSRCERDLKNPADVAWGECRMRKDPSASAVIRELCSRGKSRKHIPARPSHTFILLRIHTQPCACARRTGVHADKCQLMHINKAWQPTKQQTDKDVSPQSCPRCLLRKSRYAAFTRQQQPYLPPNNIWQTGFFCILYEHFRRLCSLSVTLTAGIIPARWGMLHGPSSGCHSNRFKSVWIFSSPWRTICARQFCKFTTEEPLDTFWSSASHTTKTTVHDDHRYPCPVAKFCHNDDLRWVQSTLSACSNGRWDFDSRAVIGFQ